MSEERQSIKNFQHLASTDAQKTNIQCFNVDVAKQNRVYDLNDQIDSNKFGNVIGRRYQPDPIIKFKCTKPKDKYMTLHLVRKKASMNTLKSYLLVNWLNMDTNLGENL